jgi:hypothetical protein
MKRIIIAAIFVLSAISVFAQDIKFTDSTLTQSEFEDFSKEFGVGLSFNPMSPAEPLGVTGFDVSTELVITDINDNEKYWKTLVDDGDPSSFLAAPRIHAQKGLPFKIDIGAMYSQIPDSNVQIWGVELKYAILEGSTVTPALSIRGTYSKLAGVDDLDVDTQSGEILISKGFLMLTPYAGISALRVNASENSDIVEFDDVHEIIYRGLAGIQITPFPLFVINFEASVGEVNQYGIKAGLRF